MDFGLFEGCITKPEPDQGQIMFYLPQRPYLFPGTLKEQILYPCQLSCTDEPLSDHELSHLLSLVELSHLQQQYDCNTEKVNWCDILSPGQQQLLSFVRLLFHKPTIAILDEATSSLTEQMERNLYAICQEKQITIVSVGHRMSLMKYHNCLLQLGDHCNWTFSDINPGKQLI